MLTVPSTALITAAVAALLTMILSFLADFFPGVATWFNAFTTSKQAWISLVLSIVIGVLMFVAGNTTVLGSASTADILSAVFGLFINIIAAVGAGQVQKTFVNNPLLRGIRSTS